MASKNLLTIPPWANYTAVDASGEVWAYSHKPDMITDGWDIKSRPHAQVEHIGSILTFEDWRDSLIAIF